MVKKVEKVNSEQKMVYNVEVRNPRAVEGREGTYRFTLIVNGVTLYGMKSIAYKDKTTGEEKSFIAFSGYKGNNDQFYNNYFFPISRELQAEIEKQIGEKLP